MTLQDQVSALKDGDYVRAVFTYFVIEGAVKKDFDSIRIPVAGTWVNLYTSHLYGPGLTSVTVIPRPLPPEPELGSFVLLVNTDISKKFRDGSSKCWARMGEETLYSWADIYPQIVKMWDKDGNEVAL